MACDLRNFISSLSFLLNFITTLATNITLLALAFYSQYADKPSCVEDARIEIGWLQAMSITGVALTVLHQIALNVSDEHYGCSWLTKRFPIPFLPSLGRIPIVGNYFNGADKQEEDGSKCSLSLFLPCDLAKVILDVPFMLAWKLLEFFESCCGLQNPKMLDRFKCCKDGKANVNRGYGDARTARDIFGVTLFLSFWALAQAMMVRGPGLEDLTGDTTSYAACDEHVENVIWANDFFIVSLISLILLNTLSMMLASKGEDTNRAVVFRCGDGGMEDLGDAYGGTNKGLRFDKPDDSFGSGSAHLRGMA